jgi:hypothetical protein
MSLNDIKHKKCAVCDKSLDRVKYWNNVQKDELIFKLNKLREGVEKSDCVCSTCIDRARRLKDEIDEVFDEIQKDDIQNDQPIIPIESDIYCGEKNSEDSSDCSSESCSTLYSIESSQDAVFVDLARKNNSTKKCVICNKKRGKKNNKLHRLTDTAVTDAYIKTSIFIPYGSRACKTHFDEYLYLKKSSLGKIIFY